MPRRQAGNGLQETLDSQVLAGSRVDRRLHFHWHDVSPTPHLLTSHYVPDLGAVASEKEDHIVVGPQLIAQLVEEGADGHGCGRLVGENPLVRRLEAESIHQHLAHPLDVVDRVVQGLPEIGVLVFVDAHPGKDKPAHTNRRLFGRGLADLFGARPGLAADVPNRGCEHNRSYGEATGEVREA